ncbi:RNA polymerase sigma factor [Chelatococcus sambhunathii]|uniref:RNA polymerase sigma factor n=1 Tax=Chelatococcus sambhunathii TaxID=363953 RepID=A0ABU1DCF7_9HYPH|nr:RNA polymerase sigma factor [Chelatococcus sambhunathii]MDR4305755.1 RNA polymerase sigma factor [Chelatococcus sambhunathii]
MTDIAWVDKALTAARPQAVAALLRYFRDLDTAEEAFQEACLRALKTWPDKGPPRDPAAWLIFVGRNVALDGLRRRSRQTELPDEDQLSDLGDAEADIAERLDRSDYRDDILRLLFVCAHPGLPSTQQIALALRIVSGLTVKQIARAFLVGEAAMEQRITRAKAKVAAAGVPFETPGAAERAERLRTVAAMVYLVFNEGYSASGEEIETRAALCDEAIRLARLLLRLFPSEPEIMGLAALMLLQHSRSGARHDAGGQIVLLEDQDRALWSRPMITEGLALMDKAIRHRRPGPYQIQAAIAAMHARAARYEDTDWAAIDALYQALERIQPSPVVTLNRAVALSKLSGPEAGLTLIAPLAERLDGYFYFHGVTGALLMELGRNAEARVAFDHAIALANSAAEAAHIRSHLDRLQSDAAVAPDH